MELMQKSPWKITLLMLIWVLMLLTHSAYLETLLHSPVCQICKCPPPPPFFYFDFAYSNIALLMSNIGPYIHHNFLYCSLLCWQLVVWWSNLYILSLWIEVMILFIIAGNGSMIFHCCCCWSVSSVFGSKCVVPPAWANRDNSVESGW